LRSSFIWSNGSSSNNNSFFNNNNGGGGPGNPSSLLKTEKDYDAAVQPSHNHIQYEETIVTAVLTRYNDLQTKMARIRATQINLILDRPDVRHALLYLEENPHYRNIVQRLSSGKEKGKEFAGKLFKSPSKIIDGIKVEDGYFSEDRIQYFEKLRTILLS
jgi:hypothetical protein